MRPSKIRIGDKLGFSKSYANEQGYDPEPGTVTDIQKVNGDYLFCIDGAIWWRCAEQNHRQYIRKG